MAEYLTPNDVAKMTHKHPETVTKALRLGELRGGRAKTGGRWLITEAAVDDWIMGNVDGRIAA